MWCVQPKNLPFCLFPWMSYKLTIGTGSSIHLSTINTAITKLGGYGKFHCPLMGANTVGINVSHVYSPYV